MLVMSTSEEIRRFRNQNTNKITQNVSVGFVLLLAPPQQCSTSSHPCTNETGFLERIVIKEDEVTEE